MRTTPGLAIAILVLVTAPALASPEVHRIQKPYDAFRAARAECRRPAQPHLAALVARAWDPASGRRFVAGSGATPQQLAELDQLMDATVGADERRRVTEQICRQRVIGHSWLEDDDAHPTRTQYEVHVQDDACARSYAPDRPCDCHHRLVLELAHDAWSYTHDRQLCGADIQENQRYRERLHLPPSDQPVAIDVALSALRSLASN